LSIKAFKNLLNSERNQEIQEYLSKLSATLEINYSLWKAKRLKRSQTQYPSQEIGWDGRNKEEKVEIFATHLSKVFKSNSCEITLEKENKLLFDDIPSTLDTFIIKKVRAVIKKRQLNPKAPAYDLITNQILQKVLEKGIKYITQICNTVLRRSFFPPRMEDSINYYDPETWPESRNLQNLQNRTDQFFVLQAFDKV
jgi:hypothetical protein